MSRQEQTNPIQAAESVSVDIGMKRVQDVREIRRASLIERLAASARNVAFLALALLLFGVAVRLHEREKDWRSQSEQLEQDRKKILLEQQEVVEVSRKLAREISDDGIAKSEGAAELEPTLPGGTTIGVQLTETQRMLKTSLEILAQANDEIEEKEQEFLGVSDFTSKVNKVRESLRKNAGQREVELKKEANLQKDKVKQLTQETNRLEDDLNFLFEEYRSSWNRFENEIAELSQQIKKPEPAPQSVSPGSAASESRRPDPNLVTLVIVVDSETNFSFLQTTLVDWYTYHNLRATSGEFVAIDVSQGGNLKRGIMTAPRPADMSKVDLPALIKNLQFARQAAPNPELIPKAFASFFATVPRDRKRQVILIAGTECKAPAADAWADVKFPVHVCIVGDGRAEEAGFSENWRSFVQAKGGEFNQITVDLQNLTSQSLVRGQVANWLEERLSPPSRAPAKKTE